MKNYRTGLMTYGYKSLAPVEFTAANDTVAAVHAREIAQRTPGCIGYSLEIRIPNRRAKCAYSYKALV